MKKIERFKRWLIRKLGGFVIYPDDDHVVINHCAVRPERFVAHCRFTQQQLYEVNGNILESEANRKLKETLAQIITSKDFVKFDKVQDEYGGIDYRATVYLINYKYMPHKKGELQ